MFKPLVPILLSTLILFACDKREEPAPQPESKAASAPVHGAAGAKPGSHEDWCGEHQVPESLCTRCNPSLAASFQATGDWCPEHGLPESQCLVCNPDLKIVRPPPSDGASP